MTHSPKAWLFDFTSLNEAIPPQWLEQLSEAEQQRAHTFKHDARRNSYIASHALAYWALRQSFGDAIKNHIIASEGAPLLINGNTQAATPARLSLSHSGNYILCAISDADTLIGCDIETPKSRINAVAIAKQFFADDEYRQLQQLADNDQSDELEKLFYRMWTSKEAWLKAQGLGIANGLKQLAIRHNGYIFHDSAETQHHWQINLHETAAYTLAIATGREGGKSFTNSAIVEQVIWNQRQLQTITILETAKLSMK